MRNKENYSKVLELKNQGKTVNEICEILGIGKGTVGYYLTKAHKQGLVYIKYSNTYLSISEQETLKKKVKDKRQNTWNQKLMNEEFESLSFERLSKRVKLEQDNKCNKCGLNEWMGEKLCLELEHKDGNHENNDRNNLEALCPNCHSLTLTWRGRNKKKREKVTDEMFINSLIENNFNARQVLLGFGMAPKGGNYLRANRLIKEIKDASR